jgi:intraflagellar transport protein 172
MCVISATQIDKRCAFEHLQVYFAAAMEASNFEGAMAILEPLERTPDTEARWLQLADAALASVATSSPDRILPVLHIAERCFSAIGNVARAAYLRRVSAQYSAGKAGDALAVVRAEVTCCLPLWCTMTRHV